MINNKVLKEDDFGKNLSLISLVVATTGSILLTTSFVWGIAIMLVSWLNLQVLTWLAALCAPICHHFFGEAGDQSMAWWVAHHPLVTAFSLTFIVAVAVQMILLPLAPVIWFFLRKSTFSTSEIDSKKNYEIKI